MKAEKLIKDKGINYAQEIVYNAPSNALEWNEGFEFKCGQSAEKITKKDKEKYFVSIPDLKKLVESHEYVQIHGLEKSKKIVENAPNDDAFYSWTLGDSGVRDKTVHVGTLKQAIADVESCMEPANDLP